MNAETGKPYDLKDPEMLQQDLDPEKDQDRAAGKVTPINETAAMICTSRNANVIPTARASMLVATASRNIVRMSSESSSLSQSFEQASLIILAPMIPSRIKADGRHQRLESAEPQADDPGFSDRYLRHGEPLADRYCESVH